MSNVMDFIKTLEQGAKGIGNATLNDVKDVGDYTAQTAQAWGRVPGQIMQSVQGQPITPNPDLSPSAQRGADTVAGLMTPTTTLPVLHAGVQGVEPAAAKAEQGVNEAVSAAKAQPGGLQAGYVRFGEKDAGAIAKKVSGGDPKEIPQSAVDIFNRNYQVPTKLASGSIDTQRTARGILAHIKSGMNPDILEQTPEMLSGANGTISKAIRKVVSTIPHPIPINNPVGAAKNVLENHKIFVNADARDDILSDIRAAVPGGGGPTTMNAEDALAFARDLEQKAEDIKQGSTYLTHRGDKEVIAQSFHAAADDIMEQVDQAASGTPIDSIKTPEMMSQLQSISPRLAEEVGQAKNVSELRSTIRDFTRFGRMMKVAKSSENSTFGQVAAGMKKQGNFSDNVANAVMNPKAAATNAISSGISKVLSPFNKTPRDELMNALSGPPDGAGGPTGKFATPNNGKADALKKTLGGAGLAALTGGAFLLGSEKNDSSSYASGKEQTNSTENNHNRTISNSAVSVNDLPKDLNSIDVKAPIPDPSTIKDTSGNSIAISDGQYATAKKQLEALKSDPAYQVFPKSGQLQGALDSLDATHNASKQVYDQYQKTAAIDQKVQDAKKLLEKTAPHFFDVNPLGQNMQAAFDPSYRQLLNDLSAIEGYTGLKGQLTGTGSKDTLQAALDQVHKQVRGDYFNSVRTQAGAQPTAPTAPVNTGGLAPLGGSSIGGDTGGGTVQGTPSGGFGGLTPL